MYKRGCGIFKRNYVYRNEKTTDNYTINIIPSCHDNYQQLLDKSVQATRE